MAKFRLFHLFVFLFISFGTFSQVGVIEEFTPNFSPVFDAQEIVFYGADFSKFGMCHPNKVGKEEEMIKFIPAWMADMNALYTTEGLTKLMKKNVVGNLQPVQNRYKSIEKEWLFFEAPKLELSEVQNAIKTYQLPEKEGVGFVLFVESFNKIEEKGLVYFTMFDIADRELLYCVKMQGDAIGPGMTNHWASVLTSGMDVFITNYREQLHKAKKNSKI